LIRALLTMTLVVLFAIMAACSKTRADEGNDAILQVQGAQFFREAMPSGETGPKVLTVTVAAHARAGAIDLACGGDLEPSATAIAFGLAGDVGYWILPAKIPAASAPASPTFEIAFALSARASPGPHQLVFRGVDGGGRFGPPLVRPLEVALGSRPTGRLVISLSWDNEADLDLHVVLPSGLELYKRNRTEYQRPPPSAGPVSPNAPTDGGVLDRDSNALCVPDGQREEDAVWTEAPPKGHYVVRVDTFALCGAPSAPWRLEALLDGVRIGAAQGTGTEEDLRFTHNRGDGVLALELDVP
jgi:hypothetical protein